jgi:predicted DNA-binding transcriptional regulator AlpA
MKRDARVTATQANRRLLTRREAATFLGVSPATMSRWAAERTGPPLVKLSDSENGTVRYPSDALDDFLAARTQHPK